MTINPEGRADARPENFISKKHLESGAAAEAAAPPPPETTPDQKAAVEKIMQDAGYFDENQSLEDKASMWQQINQIRPLSADERDSWIDANRSLQEKHHLAGEFKGTGKEYISHSGQRLTELQKLTPEQLAKKSLTKNDFDVLSAQRGHVDGRYAKETWPMSMIANEYTNRTHDLIEKLQDADMVIYLDKSARPVEWLVKSFWPDDGTQPPAHKFLNIDRVKMLREMKQDVAGSKLFDEVKENGQVDYWLGEEWVQPSMSPNGIKKHLINPNPSLINGIRALFVQGEIPQDDETWQDAVKNLPTGLEGKKVVIVDEVKSSGLTLEIAKALIHAALGDQVEISTTYFWNSRHEVLKNGAFNMTSMPVWYDNAGHYSIAQGVRGKVEPTTEDEKEDLYDKAKGRLVGDQDEDYYRMIYGDYPNSITFAQEKAARVLSAPHLREKWLNAGMASNNLQLYTGDIEALKLKHDIELLAFAKKNGINVGEPKEKIEKK